MEELSLKEIKDILESNNLLKSSKIINDEKIESISCDSRSVEKQSLFLSQNI